MSDHEFEKQVQQKLDQLKLRPSTAVWTEVEKNIRHAKRRRRFIFWLPVVFLFLATSGYVWYTSNQPGEAIAKATHHTPATASNQSTARNQSTSTATTTQPTKPVQETPVQAAQPTAANEATASIQSTTIPSSNDQIHHTENNSTLIPSVKDHDLVKGKSRAGKLNSNKRQSEHNTAVSYRHEESVQQEDEAPYIAYPHIAQSEYSISTNQAVPGLLTGQPANIFTPEKQNNTAAAPIPPIQKQQGPKWQWGITASTGYSRISQSSLFELNGLLGSPEKNLVEDLASGVAPPNISFNGQYISPAPPAEKKAAPVQPDFAWSGGLFVQRPLSKRLRLTIGLQYTYMSTHTTIGKLVQKPAVVNQGTSSATVVNRYFTSSDYRDSSQPAITNATYAVPDTSISRRYTYRFHAFEVPVLLNWQINKGRRLPPLVLDAGFSVLHLLSFDALHYDGIKNIYYKEDRLINTTQFNALMGLNVGLFQRSKTPVWIGPYLRYSLTNLVKKEVSKGQFVWSAGINVRVGLGRL